MSHRYLMYISYIGTHFRGIQKNQIIDKCEIKPSVVGAIEAGLTRFRLLNEPCVVPSSRTDAGVHALNTSVHVDLCSKSGHPYGESRLTHKLNKFFERQNLQVRINETRRVPDTFHARFSAKRRTYLYRLAIAKPKSSPTDQTTGLYLPIDEIDRCFFVDNSTFDLNLAHKAAELIKGGHDFRTFMGVTTQNKGDSYRTLRYIDAIDIEPGESTGNIFTKPPANETYNYFNIRITAPSFVNRQVRRIVATILAVAQQRLSIREVYEMLTIPSKHNWPSRIECAPPHGLYLCQVDYDDKDKEFPVSHSKCTTDQILANQTSQSNELPQ